MERVERDDEIELAVEGEIMGVGYGELKIGELGVGLRVGDHVVGGVDAEDGTVREARGNFGGDAAVAAADVQDAFVPVK